jgi:hypothetical protein
MLAKLPPLLTCKIHYHGHWPQVLTIQDLKENVWSWELCAPQGAHITSILSSLHAVELLYYPMVAEWERDARLLASRLNAIQGQRFVVFLIKRNSRRILESSKEQSSKNHGTWKILEEGFGIWGFGFLPVHDRKTGNGRYQLHPWEHVNPRACTDQASDLQYPIYYSYQKNCEL